VASYDQVSPMKDFISRNNFYLLTGLPVMVALHTVVNGSPMPVLQRVVGSFFIGIVLHL
jgi:hypothetical protein